MPTATSADSQPAHQRPHPRTIGWLGATALAMGGSNQSLFLIGALFVGQGTILGQGSAAVPLLIAGLILSWIAAPGWLELVLMYPNRVGGIAATCAEAFKPYSPILANLTGVCYWWGWIPTCGLTALLSAAAIHEWYLPGIPITALAVGIVLLFMTVNLCGVKWTARIALPTAFISAGLAFISSMAPVISGQVDWQQASTFHLTVPFSGWFGTLTGAMAGLYLIGFAAPAFEAATCHVGEMINPEKSMPRAMLASGLMAGIYFLVLPVIWLGVLGPQELGKDLMLVLGPTFAPVLGSAAKATAIWFMMFNMFHGTLQPLAGAARTLSQLADDGLVPEFLGLRAKNDTPWVSTVLTASFAIWFLLLGDPIWLVASANFTYLISIGLPNIAVWLLRKDQPGARRPYRAPRGFIMLGVAAASVWGLSALLGFQQFGLTTVLIGLVFAYSGSALYAWRKFSDRRKAGQPGIAGTLHLKLTGSMLIVLLLDGIGYYLAVQSVGSGETARLAALEDIFVAVAALTITVGLVLPGMIAHSAVEVSKAADRLATGTLADFSRAMEALGRGDLNAAHARVDLQPVPISSNDEVGNLAASFNTLQLEVARGAAGLDGAREGLHRARRELVETNTNLEQRVNELAASLIERERVEIQLRQAKEAAESADRAKSEFLAVMSHEIRTPMNAVLGYASLLRESTLSTQQREFLGHICNGGESLLVIISDILDYSKIESGKFRIELRPLEVRGCLEEAVILCQPPANKPVQLSLVIDPGIPKWITGDANRLRQILVNLISNAVKFTPTGTISVHVTQNHASGAALGLDPMLRVSITDTGIGISEQNLPRLFKPFSQVDASTTRTHGGTGLGLAISKNLIELMGGEISVQSQLGRGSTFAFTLAAHSPTSADIASRLEESPATPENAAFAAPAKTLRVLVVEDVPVNLALALHMLASLGYHADSAYNGRECLQILEQKTYDLIFMDLRMPEMDGYETTLEIRRHAAAQPGKPHIHICALTANIMSKDREACREVGMDEILAKPIRMAELKAVLDRVTATRG